MKETGRLNLICLGRGRGGSPTELALNVWARKVSDRLIRHTCRFFYGVSDAISYNNLIRQRKSFAKEAKPKSFVPSSDMGAWLIDLWLSLVSHEFFFSQKRPHLESCGLETS